LTDDAGARQILPGTDALGQDEEESEEESEEETQQEVPVTEVEYVQDPNGDIDSPGLASPSTQGTGCTRRSQRQFKPRNFQD
jgi:hypothetical protein